jgi:ParB-like chromosome segregation protein Spo0J
MTDSIVTLLVDDIVVGDDCRACNEARVSELAQSIAAVGLRHPITVRPEGDPHTIGFRWKLVSGRHRYEAMRSLHLDYVQCIKFTGTKRQARLWQISENLHRAELNALEFFEHIAEWTKLFEQEFRDSGQNVQQKKGRPQGGNALAGRKLPVPGKTEEGRRKFIERARAVASIDAKVKAEIKEANLQDNRSALLRIAKESSPSAQVAKVRELISRPAKSRTLRVHVVGDDVLKSKEDNLHRRRADEATLKALKTLWSEASPTIQKAFRKWIRRNKSNSAEEATGVSPRLA